MVFNSTYVPMSISGVPQLVFLDTLSRNFVEPVTNHVLYVSLSCNIIIGTYPVVFIIMSIETN